MDCRERRLSCRTKNLLTILLGVAVVAAVLLVSGLSDVQLYPGHEFALDILGDSNGPAARFFRAGPDIFRILWHVVGIASLVLLVPAIIYAVMTPDVLKRAVANAIILAATTYGLYLLLKGRSFANLTESMGDQSGGMSLYPGSAGEVVVNPPAWLTFVITAGILAAALGLGVVIWRRAAAGRDSSPLDMLAQEAQEAIEELRAGADLKDTVMHCYFEMSRILSEERGLRRKEAMTPREFETTLKLAGLPGPPVERLTQLFETVRYGAHTPEAQEENEAVACLEAIVDACENLA
jgi:hypothetical protein